jgi:DNA recombination protein RmuC
MIFIGLTIGIIIGALGAIVLLGRRTRSSEVEIRTLESELAQKDEQIRTQDERHDREIELMRADEVRMKEQMHLISSDVLEQTSKRLAEQMAERQKLEQQQAQNEMEKRATEIKTVVNPVTDQLKQVQKKVEELETQRVKAQSELGEQIRFLKEGVTDLSSKAGGLTAALKRPSGRGSWGEIQLRNVIEMAGMVEHCDFETQVTVQDDERRLRPDVVIKMPGERSVVVDAKVPMEAFLNAQEAGDEQTREAFLAQHAQQVRNHVSDLRKKDYQSQFEQSPELVIMFVPSEGIYHSALAQDSTLLEYGLTEKVLIATPTTLIGILQAINYGWGQDIIARSAQEIAEAGRELHKRMLTFADPLAKVGRQLDSAASSYNQAIGSYERMVVPQLRKIEAAGAKSAKEMSELPSVDTAVREIVIDTTVVEDDPRAELEEPAEPLGEIELP